jgi:hypothetical protein
LTVAFWQPPVQMTSQAYFWGQLMNALLQLPVPPHCTSQANPAGQLMVPEHDEELQSMKHVPPAQPPVQAPGHAPPGGAGSCEQVKAQTPAPLQVLVLPHSSSGSSPTGTFAQVPLVTPVFAALHALHVPVQALLQQTPSMQLPLAHSLGAAQGSPSGWLPPAHMPEPSQLPPTPQGVPCGAGGFDGTPLVQTSIVHSMPSTGRSVLSF